MSYKIKSNYIVFNVFDSYDNLKRNIKTRDFFK